MVKNPILLSIIAAIILVFFSCESDQNELDTLSPNQDLNLDSLQAIESNPDFFKEAEAFQKSLDSLNKGSGELDRANQLSNERMASTLNSNIADKLWLAHKGRSSNNVHLLGTTNASSWSDIHVPGQTEGAGPTIAYFGGNLFVGYKGAQTHELYYTYSSNGTSWSGSNKIPGGQKTSKSPALVSHDNKLYFIYKGRSDNRIHYAYTYNSNASTWYYKGHLSNSTSTGGINACVFKGKLYQFHRNPNGQIGYAINTSGTNWGNERIINRQVGSGVACAVFQGKLHIVYNDNVDTGKKCKLPVDTDGDGEPDSEIEVDCDGRFNGGSLFHAWSTDGLSWTTSSFIGSQKTRKAPALAVLNNKLYVAYKGLNSDNIHHASFNGSSWTYHGHRGGSATTERPALFSITPSANTNLARNSYVSASSTYPGYSASRTKDGNRNTTVGGAYSWTNTHPGLPGWIKYDLRSTKSINKFVLYTSSGYPIKDYKIQYSTNNSTWYTAVTFRGNTSTQRTHTISPRSARYVRIYCERGPDRQNIYARVNEFEIYGN